MRIGRHRTPDLLGIQRRAGTRDRHAAPEGRRDQQLVLHAVRIEGDRRREDASRNLTGIDRGVLVDAPDVVPLALDEQHAGRAGASRSSHLVLERLADEVDQAADDVARIAASEGLDRPPPDFGRGVEDGQGGQGVGGRRPVDLAEHLHGRDPRSLAPAGEYGPDHRHGAGVGHLGDRRLGLGATARVLGFQGVAQPLQLRLPLLIGVALTLALHPLGGQLVGLDPAVSLLLVSQSSPRRLSRRVQPDDFRVVRDRLLLEPFLLAPGPQPGLGVGLARRRRAALEVLADQALIGRIVLDLPLDDLRTVPLALMHDQAHQPACQGVRRIVEDGHRQVLHPLGRQAMRLAPQGQPDVGPGIAARLGLGGLVGGQVRRVRRIRWSSIGRGDQDGTDQDDREHDSDSLE